MSSVANRGAVQSGAEELAEADGTVISLYMDEIPAFVESALASLYGTLHASMPFFRVFRSTEGVSCYVARRNDRLAVVLLFACRGRRIDVLNEMIDIEQADIERFARYLFRRFPQADIIDFKALKTGTDKFAFPVQRHNAKDTYVIALPASPEEYIASIGKSTRANIRQQTNSVARHLPSLQTHFFTDQDIDEQHVREIIRLSENNIQSRGAKVSHDIDRILRLVKTCGFVTVMSIDGRICAGSVNYRIGTSYFGEVTGYDGHYEKFSLGKLCVYRTVCESIVRGGKKFYLGGGDFDFKRRMLGVVLDMDEMRMYRSHWKMLVNPDQVAGALLKAGVRALKKRLHRHKQDLLGKIAFKVFYTVKNRKAHS